jgi:hypothetical protein
MYAPDAYGEVVWFGRRGAGVKSAVAHRSNRIERGIPPTTEAKEPFSGKSTK